MFIREENLISLEDDIKTYEDLDRIVNLLIDSVCEFGVQPGKYNHRVRLTVDSVEYEDD